MPTPEPPEPVNCRPLAFEKLREQLPVIETSRGLLFGAIAVAMHDMGEVDPRAIEDRIGALAAKVRVRVRSKQPRAMLAHAHAVLFDEIGFTGNVDDYYHPDNSYLPMVLKTRRGLPITLSLLYKCVLERLGLKVHGINAPAHFMAGVEIDNTLMLVDPFFGGRSLSVDEAVALIEKMTHAATDVSQVVRIAGHRIWLYRLIENLRQTFVRMERHEDMAAMTELQRLLQDA